MSPARVIQELDDVRTFLIYVKACWAIGAGSVQRTEVMQERLEAVISHLKSEGAEEG